MASSFLRFQLWIEIMATKTVFITSGTTFTIPLDFQSVVAVHAIGGGGGGYYCGGGGGAYAQSTAVTGLVAGGTAYCSLGAGGTENGTNGGVTWFNSSISTVPAGASQGAYADSGKSTQAENVNPAGGLASSSVGTLKKNGGSGAVGVGNNWSPLYWWAKWRWWQRKWRHKRRRCGWGYKHRWRCGNYVYPNV